MQYKGFMIRTVSVFECCVNASIISTLDGLWPVIEHEGLF